MGIRENKATVERFDQLTGACELDPLGDRSPGYAARIIRCLDRSPGYAARISRGGDRLGS